MHIYRHLAIMVYSEKLLNIIAFMKCEDHHTKKLIKVLTYKHENRLQISVGYFTARQHYVYYVYAKLQILTLQIAY